MACATLCRAVGEIEALRQSTADPWEVVESLLVKGGCSFHDWQTVHGSEPNRSAGQRRGLAIHLCSADSVALGGPLTVYVSDPRANPALAQRVRL